MEKIKLSEIFDIQIGKTPSRSVSDYWGIGNDWLSIADLNNLEDGKYVLNSSEQITEKAIKESGCIKIESNTILFSFKLSIGKIAITKKAFFTNEAIAALKIKNPEKYNINYLFYALKTIKTEEYADNGAKGYTLNKGTLSSILVPIIDLNQQNKIVAQLDLIQFLINKRKKSIVLLNEIVNSVFVDMFGDPIHNPKNIKKVHLNTLGNWHCGGTPSRSMPQYFIGDIPWYNSGELNDIYISKSHETISNLALEKSTAKRIERYSLLLGMYDTAALKSSINLNEASCNQAIAFAKLNEEICNVLYVYFAVQLSKKYYLDQRLGARQQNLNLTAIKNIEIPLPNITLQNEFSNKVVLLLNHKSYLQNSRDILEKLLKSFIQVTFSEKDLHEKSDIELYLGDIFLQHELFGKIQTQDFLLNEEYQQAKKILFELLESGVSQISQTYDNKTRKIILQIT